MTGCWVGVPAADGNCHRTTVGRCARFEARSSGAYSRIGTTNCKLLRPQNGR